MLAEVSSPHKLSAFILMFLWILNIVNSSLYKDECTNYSDTRFYIYSRDNPVREIEASPSNLTSIKIGKRGIVFIIHGFTSSSRGKNLVTLRDAFLQSERDVDVIMVDWEVGAARSYLEAVKMTKVIGRIVAKFIAVQLVKDNQVSIKSVHLIGHSLGAQISGYAGKELIKMKLKLPRISGLDPAAPFFLEKPLKDRLCAYDADFVDIIHTSVLTFVKPIGHVDFYVCGSVIQPGCHADVSCSHSRSTLYYAASVRGKCHFKSVPCKKSLPRFSVMCPPEQCDENCGEMGYDSVVAEGRGCQELAAASTPPYCINETNKHMPHATCCLQKMMHQSLKEYTDSNVYVHL